MRNTCAAATSVKVSLTNYIILADVFVKIVPLYTSLAIIEGLALGQIGAASVDNTHSI